jgi:hypothetical protein
MASNVIKYSFPLSDTASTAPVPAKPDPSQQANQILLQHGNAGNNDQAYAVGKDIADIAKTDPAQAAAVMKNVQDRLRQTDKGDNVASGFVDNLDDNQLQNVARAPGASDVLRTLQTNLTTGNVHEKERNQAARIQKALGETFSADYQGIDPDSDQAQSTDLNSASNTKASPEAAAAALKRRGNVSFSDPAASVQAFTTQLDAHKNDANWLQSYFASLGSNKTAELISLATTSGGYSNYLAVGQKDKAADQFQKNAASIRDALNTMEQSGNLRQNDMNNLVNSMQKQHFNPEVAIEIFGKSPNKNLQEEFVTAGAANGDPAVAASASMVLSQMDGADQARILEGMDHDQTLNQFVRGAMAGQTAVVNLDIYLRTGTFQPISVSGMTGILSAATDKISNGYPYYSPSPFSADLKHKLFDAVATGLTDSQAFSRVSGDTDFKNALSSLTIQQHKDFIDSALSADGPNGEDLSVPTRDQYSKVLQLTLFTPPLGNQAGDLMKYLDSTYKGIASDLNTLSDKDFEAKYGRNRAAMAHAYGEMTAVFFKALDEGLTKVKDDAQQAAEVMEPIFKLIDFGTGKALDGEEAGPIGKAISNALNATGAIDSVKEAIESKIRQGYIKDALNDMKDQGVDISKLGDQLYEEVYNDLLPNATSPNGTYHSVSIKDAWQNGYDHVNGAPKT